MYAPVPANSLTIEFKRKNLPAAKCRKCGAKMYPKSLLKPHLNRHQRKELWLMAEVIKLQNIFSRMRRIA